MCNHCSLRMTGDSGVSILPTKNTSFISESSPIPLFHSRKTIYIICRKKEKKNSWPEAYCHLTTSSFPSAPILQPPVPIAISKFCLPFPPEFSSISFFSSFSQHDMANLYCVQGFFLQNCARRSSRLGFFFGGWGRSPRNPTPQLLSLSSSFYLLSFWERFCLKKLFSWLKIKLKIPGLVLASSMCRGRWPRRPLQAPGSQR